LVNFSWCQTLGELTIGARQGNYFGMTSLREFRLVFISSRGRKIRTINYVGEMTIVSIG
jgi:hypothetical protein